MKKSLLIILSVLVIASSVSLVYASNVEHIPKETSQYSYKTIDRDLTVNALANNQRLEISRVVEGIDGANIFWSYNIVLSNSAETVTINRVFTDEETGNLVLYATNTDTQSKRITVRASIAGFD